MTWVKYDIIYCISYEVNTVNTWFAMAEDIALAESNGMFLFV